MRRTVLQMSCVLWPLLLLNSCIDYSEELTLRANGSARIYSTMTMADPVGGLGGDGDLPFDSEHEFEDGVGRSWTERKDGKLVTHVEAEIKDFRRSGALSPGDKALGKFSPDWYTVESLGLGRYRLSRTVSFPDSGELAPAADNPLGQLGGAFGQSLMDSMLEGYEFKVSLSAPIILSSNADEKDGLGRAVWTRELKSLAGQNGQPISIEATVLLLDLRLLAIGGGALLIILILLAVRALRRGRSAGRSDVPTSVDQPGAGL